MAPNAPIAWLEREDKSRGSSGSPPSTLPRKLSLECSSCGYGVARATPPERCPMCGREDAWVHSPWRPFTRRQLS